MEFSGFLDTFQKITHFKGLLQRNKQVFQLLSSLTKYYYYYYFTSHFIYYTWLHCTLQDWRSVTEDSFFPLSKKFAK